MDIYVVTMYRWGSRENHSYVLGVWRNAVIATRHCSAEEAWRGGKYTGEILKFQLDASADDVKPVAIKGLPAPQIPEEIKAS